MSDTHRPHHWRFFRSGGFDQVRIDGADDLRHLAELDQKLWAVLACPTVGLECDPRTLQLMDTDGDGRIRVPEVCTAVQWVCERLVDPGLLFEPGDTLPLAAIRDDGAEGAHLRAAAQQVLARLDKPQADALALADLADPARLFAPHQPNGDGVVPAELAADDEAVAALIAQVVATQGGVTDRSGQPGVSQATLDAFLAAAQQVLDWQAQAASDSGLLAWGERTPQALAAFDAVQAKVQDYYTRCRLAAFDARATEALNPADERYTELSTLALSDADSTVADLPLARVTPAAVLPLVDGLNPAWQARITALREAVVLPALGERAQLTLAEWTTLAERFAAYRAWLTARPDTPVAELSPDALQGWLAGDAPARLAALIAHDQAADANAEGVDALERLLRLRRDLVTLLRNFVNLSDFYGPERPAIFQAGTLYIDQRSCALCLPVADMGRHASLAPLSGSYLVYCQCVRQGEAPRTIVAAMTGGDADDMMVPGRNGLFYDRQGRDWHASVLKVVPAPISVRQAFWSPYKRVARMVGEQLQKFAAARDQAVEAKAAAGVADASAKAQAADAKPPQAFDIAKFAGIFAAIGLALGALGTALAAVVSGLLALPLWQVPLVLGGIVLLISGPSMLLAWLKLRQRNLGPLLDANGWAVNIRARINIPFGASLTGVAQLPAGAERALADPYAERPFPWGRWAVAALLVGLAWWAWRSGWWAQPWGG